VTSSAAVENRRQAMFATVLTDKPGRHTPPGLSYALFQSEFELHGLWSVSKKPISSVSTESVSTFGGDKTVDHVILEVRVFRIEGRSRERQVGVSSS
jgi:hypothetical protein